MEICQKGDKQMEEEISKVYKGKKINKGVCSSSSRASCRIPMMFLTGYPT